MMEKQTAVDWLVEQYANENYGIEIYEQAKAMEKEQIEDAWESGHLDYEILMHDNSQQYYSETYSK